MSIDWLISHSFLKYSAANLTESWLAHDLHSPWASASIKSPPFDGNKNVICLSELVSPVCHPY